MFLIKQSLNSRTIKSLLRLYSIGRKNHYDILNLRRNCSDKDIKEAFIQLSKEYHPDKNKDAKAQEKFVNVVEAYNVLGKPSSRARYDNMIAIETKNSYVYRTHVPYNLRKNPQYSYYYASQTQANTSNTNARSSFYQQSASARPTIKVPNYVIISLCAGVALIGVVLQVYVIRNMYIAQRQQAMEKSKQLAEELEAVRANALANGNEMQTRLLLDRIVTAANPTVATASLGQALVNDKKDSKTFLMEMGVPDDVPLEEYTPIYELSDSFQTACRIIKRIISILLS